MSSHQHAKTPVTEVILMAMLGCLLMMSCSTRRLMVNGFVDLAQHGMPVIEQEDDLVLLAEAMPAQIKLFETMLASDPDNPDLLVLMSRLYGAYAFAILETQWERKKYADTNSQTDTELKAMETRLVRYFEKGSDSALRALETHHPGARSQLASPRRAAAFFQSLDLSDVPAIFWYGFNLGFWIQHNVDSVTAMAQAYLVEKAMLRILELDPTYYYGSAHIILMVYYASRPSMTGGNPSLAAAHYRDHQMQWPKVGGLRQLFWARYYLVQQQDRAAFTQVLEKVASAPLIGAQPLKMMESVAVARAAVYLQATNQFFDAP
jgi:hypothetical protein